jgi:hypothetical protein
VYLHAHADSPPSDEDVAAALGLGDGDYLYLTATSAQARARVALTPPTQVDADERPHLVFHEVLRLLCGEPTLTRSEQRIILQRHADVLAAGDEARRRQLRHDAEAWSEALAELDALGVDLAHGIPPAIAEQLTHPALGGLLTSRRMRSEAPSATPAD